MKWIHLFLMKPISRIVGFIIRKDTSVFTLGIVAHSLGNFLVNVLLSGYIVFHFDIVISLFLVFIANILKVIIMVALYDHYGKDIFGIESTKTERGAENKIIKKIKKVLLYLEKRSKNMTYIVLILIDHFFGVIYIRKEHHVYKGIPREDWIIISIALGIATIVLVAGWELVEIIWKIIKWLMS